MYDFNDFSVHSFEFGLLPVRSACGWITLRDPYGEFMGPSLKKRSLQKLLSKPFIGYQTDFRNSHSWKIGLRMRSFRLKRFLPEKNYVEENSIEHIKGPKYIYLGAKGGYINRYQLERKFESGIFGKIELMFVTDSYAKKWMETPPLKVIPVLGYEFQYFPLPNQLQHFLTVGINIPIL